MQQVLAIIAEIEAASPGKLTPEERRAERNRRYYESNLRRDRLNSDGEGVLNKTVERLNSDGGASEFKTPPSPPPSSPGTPPSAPTPPEEQASAPVHTREAAAETAAKPEPKPKASRPPKPHERIRWTPEAEWTGITDEDRAKLAKAYPACDLDRQLAAMTMWLLANPAEARKSKWFRFITNWLSRSQEKGGDARIERRTENAAAAAIKAALTAPAIDDPRHATIITDFPFVFKDVWRRPYAPNENDASALRAFLSAWPKDSTADDFLDTARRILETAQKDPKAWSCGKSQTIAGLCKHWNEAAAESDPLKAKTDSGSPGGKPQPSQTPAVNRWNGTKLT